MRLRAVRAEIAAAMRSPTAKQKEACARYCHTMSAAGLIGGVTLVFSDSTISVSAVFRALSMLLAAVILFLLGVALNKEP